MTAKFTSIPRVLATLTLLGTLATFVPPGEACSVPVFRYALERWPPDPYELIVFHRGELPGDAQAVVDWLKRSSVEESPTANYTLRMVNLDGELDSPTQVQWQAQRTDELPWLALHYPRATTDGGVAWNGPLTMQAAQRVVDSPLRQEVARRILQGESAVWVFLESGNARKDNAAAERIEAELVTLTDELELPEQTDLYGNVMPIEQQRAMGLRLAFSMIRLPHGVADEEVFRSMLLHSEPDLATEYASEPMIFPVFGRGRALYALVGAGITPGNIREACEFVAGACSCQVKELNPGTDLLMTVDWEAGLESRLADALELPPLMSLPVISEGEAEKGIAEIESVSGELPLSLDAGTDREPGVGDRGATRGIGALRRNVLIALGVIVILALLATFRSRKD